jgi:hypothetical protein
MSLAIRDGGAERESWLRIKGESHKAYQAAVCFFEMGANRSIQAVAIRLSKSRQLCQRWALRWWWNQRAVAYDDYQARLNSRRTRRAAP